MNHMEKWGLSKKAIFVPTLLFFLALCLYLLLALVYALPTERMQKNMKDSVAIFESEDNFKIK